MLLFFHLAVDGVKAEPLEKQRRRMNKAIDSESHAVTNGFTEILSLWIKRGKVLADCAH